MKRLWNVIRGDSFGGIGFVIELEFYAFVGRGFWDWIRFMKVHEGLGICGDVIADDEAFVLWVCILDVISRTIRVSIIYHVFCFD